MSEVYGLGSQLRDFLRELLYAPESRKSLTDPVVDDQPGPDLWVDQVGQPQAQDLAGSAQVDPELVVAGLFLPPLVVGPPPVRRRRR